MIHTTGATSVLPMPHISFKPAANPSPTPSTTPPTKPAPHTPPTKPAPHTPPTNPTTPTKPTTPKHKNKPKPKPTPTRTPTTTPPPPPDASQFFEGAWLTPRPPEAAVQGTRALTPGLQNLGNTCFLNAGLQCLLHAPPLADLLLGGHAHAHVAKTPCKFCTFCELRALAKGMHTSSGNARMLAPTAFARHARLVCSSFRAGRQEDAHEFVRALLDGMTRAEVSGCGSLTPVRWENEMRTTVHRVFGGVLQSRVVCSACEGASVTSEPFLDLSLEMAKCSSVDAALRHFTLAETLKGDNRYRCDACEELVVAVKTLVVRRAPNVLTLHLKRFDRSKKDNRFVEFPTTIDMAPFMNGLPDGQRPVYDLTGVLVHQGSSRQFGHYVAYVKLANGSWCLKDDSTSRIVPLQTVLKQKAYLLFYSRADEPAPASPKTPAAQTTPPKQAAATPTATPTRPKPSPKSAPAMPAKKFATPSLATKLFSVKGSRTPSPTKRTSDSPRKPTSRSPPRTPTRTPPTTPPDSPPADDIRLSLSEESEDEQRICLLRRRSSRSRASKTTPPGTPPCPARASVDTRASEDRSPSPPGDSPTPTRPANPVRSLLVGGGDSVCKAVCRAFGVLQPAGRVEKRRADDDGRRPKAVRSTKSPRLARVSRESLDGVRPDVVMPRVPDDVTNVERVEKIEKMGSGHVFGAEGVDAWGNGDDEVDPNATSVRSFARPRIVKRRRAGDDLDEEYDRGRVRRVKARGNPDAARPGDSRSNDGRAEGNGFDSLADRRNRMNQGRPG